MQGGGGEEMGSSPWEFSTTVEELVWRRTTEGEREKRGEVSRGRCSLVSENCHLHPCNTKAQGLWKGSNPRNACLSWSGSPLHLRRQPQSHAHRVTQTKHGDSQRGAHPGEAGHGHQLCALPTQPSLPVHPSSSISKVLSPVLSKKRCGFSLRGLGYTV